MSAVDRVECVSPVLVPLAEESPSRVAGLAFSARAWLRAHPGAGAWLALSSALAARAAARPWPARAVALVRGGDELDAALSRLLGDGVAPPAGAPAGAFFGELDGDPAAAVRGGLPGRQAFLIGGTGAQWSGMGRSLWGHRAFRLAMIECEAAFASHVAFSPFEMMSEVRNRTALDELGVAAISTFSLCFSLDRLLRSWGVVPEAIAGHSMGEIVGAALAGALSLADAATVMAAWCRVQRHAPPGQMLVVALSAREVEALLSTGGAADISMAAHNGPRSTTLSGDPAALAALRERLVASGHRCRLLSTGGAFHSHLMEPLRAPLLASLTAITPRPLELAFYSTVGRATGGPADAPACADFSAEHWWRNLRNPVDFEGALRRMAGDGYGAFWELGPHPTLSASIAECLEGQAREPAIFPTLQRDVDAAESLVGSAGRYFARGGELAWRELYAGAEPGAWGEPIELDPVVARPLPREGLAAARRGAAAVLAAPPDARRELLLHAVAAAAAELIGAPASVLALAADRSWIELGLESLHAVKLKATLQRELQLEVPLARFLSGESLASFVVELERQLERREAALAAAPRPGTRSEALRELGNDEVDSLLATLVKRCPPDELAALLREVEAAS